MGRSYGNFITGENVGDILNADSKVDRNIQGDVLAQLEAGRDLNDIRHDAQSGWDMVGNSLMNFCVNTIFSLINGSLGGLTGIGEAIRDGEISKIWNNSLTNAIADGQIETKQNFMNYRGEETKNEWSIFFADMFERPWFTIGILLLLIVNPLLMIKSKQEKLKNEPLYDKLKRLCNPNNFIKGNNYDKDKVDKANAIYKRLLEINGENHEVLFEVQQQAVAELGINLINTKKLAELKKKVNPKNYMSPYDAEKVTLANELFAILTKSKLTYNEMVEVEEKSKKLD